MSKGNDYPSAGFELPTDKYGNAAQALSLKDGSTLHLTVGGTNQTALIPAVQAEPKRLWICQIASEKNVYIKFGAGTTAVATAADPIFMAGTQPVNLPLGTRSVGVLSVDASPGFFCITPLE